MPSLKPNPTKTNSAAPASSTNGHQESRLLGDLVRVEWLHSPPPLERLEAAVGRERLSQVLLLVALTPEEDDSLSRAYPATQAA